MITKFDNADVHYVLTEEYLKEHKYAWANNLIKHENIAFNDLNMTVLPTPCIQGAQIPIHKQLEIYNKNHNQQIYQQLEYEVKTKEPIEAIITWINNKTLTSFSDRSGIPVIHNELGALRPNLWKDTIYLDFSGVNGNTEFSRRLHKFLEIHEDLELLSHEELLNLMALDKTTVMDIYNSRKESDKIGLALQVDRDSNLLMYSNGWGTIDLINCAYNNYGKESLLVKNHPHSSAQYGGDGFEYAQTPTELLKRSKRIVTINSSMGFEAMLLGKEATIMGDNPFYCMQNLSEKEMLRALNFACISYLVNAKLLFNKEYYNFRMGCKDEKELFKVGLENWIKY